jgi:hypothetical protein
MKGTTMDTDIRDPEVAALVPFFGATAGQLEALRQDNIELALNPGTRTVLGHSEHHASPLDPIGQVIEEVTYYREQGIPPIPELPDPRPTVPATLLALANPPHNQLQHVVTCFNAHRGFYVALSR